ncbi:DUF58 domain-containing protein [Phormidesmis priestleyi ULC007]|uniref:DUF58 domain-containing protein n=1 Tax=Phormidesmis priestleyi ULC007 TaxID=1920490 RepID=A0A2T1DK66_9CYAN|nr:DUF58 domain-containing protein [Phormidesmis priestleyi]PSB20866.1 DUF58 domain-containing protein [Phormidesmis priestleyi ULC007]PZO51821.1 MAG: DUF58 domain-containing protein [Phormidesmis priestleyi]
MIPARRTYGLLIFGVAIAALIATVWDAQTRVAAWLTALLIWNGLILGLAIWDSRRVSRVRVERSALSRLSIGRDNAVSLSVETGQAAEVQIYDNYPIEFGVSQMPLAAKLPSNSTQDLLYTVHPTLRGEYLWGAIQVRQLSPWRLGWHDWKIPQVQKVAVYPDLIGLRSLSIRLTLQSAGSIRRARRLGIGTEFAELRDYGIGDDPRFIDWKATARRGQPLVRVLEPEQEQTLIILLDRGRLMTANVKGLSRFDWGLNATLSLALAGLHRGDRVGVGVFDRQLHTWIPPERGQSHLTHLIERLTPIQPEIIEPDYLGAVTALANQQTRRALVVLITDIVDITASAELLAALGRLTPRYLPFCVTLRDPQVDRQANAVTEDVPSTYARAVALDLLAQRQVAFADLKRKGVLVLDAPANQITEQLVDRYLQLKAKNQL